MSRKIIYANLRPHCIERHLIKKFGIAVVTGIRYR